MKKKYTIEEIRASLVNVGVHEIYYGPFENNVIKDLKILHKQLQGLYSRLRNSLLNAEDEKNV